MKRLVILFFSLLLLVSCGPKMTEGVVVEKYYRPSWVHLQPYLVGKGMVLVPMTMPETWNVVIEKDGRKKHLNVDRQTFERIEIGQEVKIEKKKKK